MQSAFKQILVNFLKFKGDFLKMPSKYKLPIKCFVKETHPYLLLTDGIYFIQAYLTKEALDNFK